VLQLPQDITPELIKTIADALVPAVTGRVNLIERATIPIEQCYCVLSASFMLELFSHTYACGAAAARKMGLTPTAGETEGALARRLHFHLISKLGGQRACVDVVKQYNHALIKKEQDGDLVEFFLVGSMTFVAVLWGDIRSYCEIITMRIAEQELLEAQIKEGVQLNAGLLEAMFFTWWSLPCLIRFHMLGLAERWVRVLESDTWDGAAAAFDEGWSVCKTRNVAFGSILRSVLAALLC
jgi:hypothetical protein